MFCTEQEASTKWCPMVRARTSTVASPSPVAGYNCYEDSERDASEPSSRQSPKTGDHSLCIASRCMMWRRATIGTGYCGLAGEPARDAIRRGDPG